MQLKKTPFRIGGHNYIIESEGVSADRFYMVDSFIRRQADRADGLSIVQCLHIRMESRTLSPEQQALLVRIRETLAGDDLQVMNSILTQFALYWEYR